MADNAAHLAPMFRRFEGLGRKDQAAILERLSEDERAALEGAIAAGKRSQAEEAERLRASDRQYLGYSAWLADLVEASVSADETPLTGAASKALAAEHRAMIDLMDVQAPTGWRAVLARLQEFVAPKEANSR